MSVKYSSGKWAHGFCDRCSQRFQLKDLKKLTIKTKVTNILVCKSCWDFDHPQLLIGMYPVYDPQALRNPRPDTSYYQAGLNGLQLTLTDNGVPTTEVVFSNGVGHQLAALHSMMQPLHLITLLPKHLLALFQSQLRERLCQAKLKQNLPLK